jgi:hypothetical protein
VTLIIGIGILLLRKETLAFQRQFRKINGFGQRL